MKWNRAALQRPNTLHHLGVGALSRAVLSMGIVDRRGPIHTHPDVDVPLVKEIAPLIVDEHCIRLDRMAYRERVAAGCQFGKDLSVIADRKCERFAGMPNHTQVRAHHAG